MEDFKYYKVTAVDQQGNEVGSYVKADELRSYSAMLSSEYGNVEVEGLNDEDLPEEIADLFKKIETELAKLAKNESK